MPNLASVLKTEVARLARKELRTENERLKKSISAQRADIVNLKRRVQELEKTVRQLTKLSVAGRTKASQSTADADSADPSGLRFRAGGMAANRKRLGLSAADFGMLVGATGQSVYGWESGKSKPKPKNLLAIAALRGVGKREVAERLAKLKS
jgi:DNA-binding transcriptional regulator YiaG